MLRPRVIPVLLLRSKGLVKTKQFKDFKYIGDPLNAIKIFNEKEADELFFLDIDSTTKKNEPDYDLIQKLAIESRMPLCVGGGIKSVDQARKIIELGVEKIAISSAAISNPEILKEISQVIGKQSVVVVLDYKKSGIFGTTNLFTSNGSKNTSIRLLDFVDQIESMDCVGEIVLQSISNDGMKNGYDEKTFAEVKRRFSGPLTILGGALDMSHLNSFLKKFPQAGVAAGSIFVLKGKYDAVLINYPTIAERFKIIK